MNKLKITLILLSITASVNAQNGVNTPYSRYGFGIMSERAMGFNKGMGGVAQGFRNGQEVNVANPASYSAVDSLTALFDLGISLQNGNYKMGNLQQNIRNASFDYFAFQFRATKNVGMALGVMPITNIKYSFTSPNEPLLDGITSSYSFNGDGGLREVFIGAGWRPVSPLSIGINASYLWGDYTHNMTMSFNESNAFSVARIYSANISTYNVQGGIQYIQNINKKDKIVIGATYTLGHDVGNSAYRDTRTLNNSSVEAQTIDTIKNAFQFPHSIAAGITYYHSNILRIGADFELQKWGDCKFPNQQAEYTNSNITSGMLYQSTPGQLYDRTKISAGFDWIPTQTGKGIFSKSTYKFGGYYSNTYAKADQTGTVTDKPYEFGLSAGITMPIVNRNIWHNSPKINVSVQWVHTNIPYLNVNTKRQSTLTENYFKLCLGVTFSEYWFYKWKVQ